MFIADYFLIGQTTEKPTCVKSVKRKRKTNHGFVAIATNYLQSSANGPKLFTIFTSMAPIFYIQSHGCENGAKLGAIDAEIMETFEPFTPKL